VALGVLVDPPIVDQSDRHSIQEVPFLPACFSCDHEARVFEHAQVLHDAEAGHFHLGLKLGERAAVTLEKPVEQESPRRVRESLEHEGIVGHVWRIGDRMVTCQERGEHRWSHRPHPFMRSLRARARGFPFRV